MTMKLTGAGATLIEQSEGFRAYPYWDAAGRVWTQGYGSTQGIGQHSPPMTRASAEARLKREVDQQYGRAVNGVKTLEGHQNKFDATCSATYNCGVGLVANTTTFGRDLRARAWVAAANALLAWNKAGGQVMAGLAARRQRERALFLKAEPAVDRLKGVSLAERHICDSRIHYERLIHGGHNTAANRVASHAYGLRIGAQQRRLWIDAKVHGKGWGTGLSGRGHRWQLLQAVKTSRIH